MARHFMLHLLWLGVKVNEEKSAVFLSPKFVLGPGSVNFKYYFNVDFPRGHIAIKGFSVEVVDESGNSVPLYETYLHHWVAVRYYALKDAEMPEKNDPDQLHLIIVKNSGVCNNIVQYFGPSESRKNTLHLPDPYGIEDEYGQPLPPGYAGGLQCYYDDTTCKSREGFTGNKRRFYLRYTVKWVNWEESICPVRIYIFDITYTAIKGNHSEAVCQVEYDIEACDSTGVDRDVICVENKKTSVVLPTGGYLIYGVAHQHFGGIGSALYGEDGRLICTSMPVYGDGVEAGNKDGYLVGMSTCYPQPGSVKILDGETLVFESNYSSSSKHTGVMGYFYILVSDQLPKSLPMSIVA
ncbi:hypothetical protein C5167_012644 [Papaver somniferum]|uniref:Stress up-regulated Nod 19 protein n=1 Tax=Papaver somniferum TaxID=3469 RepID=A0A4Y7IY16_PAPSO|nr:hypothetical protein C5167_012644 [Papaver somniferum]